MPNYTRKYQHNSEFFHTLCPASEYWMGFFAADGCINDYASNRQPILQIGLKESDFDHLVKYHKALDATYPVKRTKRGKALSAISSQGLVDGLTLHGCAGRSLDREPKNALEKSKHFWRGAVDGDGWLTQLKRTAKGKDYIYPVLGICGGIGIVSGLRSFLIDALGDIGYLKSNIRCRGNYYSWEIRGTRAIKAIKFLYEDAPESLVLNRKAERAKELLCL